MSVSDTTRCAFFVVRKKRCCRMLVKPGHAYCGEHAHLQDDQRLSIIKDQDASAPAPGRILCPNDPKHSCDAARLDTHLAKCPSRPKPSLPYVNPGHNGATDGNDAPLSIREVADDVLVDLIARVNKVHKEFVDGHLREDVLTHDLLEQEMAKNASFYGPEVLKHLVQNASLLGHLRENELLKENTTFVEFGSGRGQLTYWIVKSTLGLEHCRYFLVDRDSHRHKFDNKLKNEGPEVNAAVERVGRIRADIQDLVLEKFPGVNEDSNDIVSVSKHLCGVATDFALNCVQNFVSESDENGRRTKAILIAVCCHHRCLWSSYTGKEFFLSNGFTPVDFELVCGLTSWWTCGTGKPRTPRDPIESPEPERNEAPLEKVVSRYENLNLTREIREGIGRRCKQLIDHGRLLFAKHNLRMKHSKLLYYVDNKYTLENVALLCKK